MAGGGEVQNVRVGVVGAGAIAQVAHLPVLRKLRGVQVVGICDNDGPKARALAARFESGAAFGDVEEMLELATPDAVVVCTPNHLHEAHAVSALSAGAHVLVERPIAMSAAGAARVLEAAASHQRMALVAMNHRFRADVQAVRGFLKGGELGPLSTIRCGWQVFRQSHASLGWRSRHDESGGGVIVDLALPMLDLALWLAGKPAVERVSAYLDRPPGSRQVEEIGAAQLYCEGNLSIFCDVSWRHVGEGERTWLDVQGARGSASISPLRVFKELHGTSVDVTPTGAAGRENPFTASYRSEWAYFLAGIRGEVRLTPPGDQVHLQQVVEAIYRSADEQRDVSL
jgi:predicted dehydrogenase